MVGLQLVLEELEGVAVLDEKALMMALLSAGPRGQRELFGALDEGSEEIDPAWAAQVERVLSATPSYVVSSLQQGELLGRRRDLEIGVAMKAMQRRGSSRDISNLLALVLSSDLDESLDPKASKAFSETLESLLRRDGASYGVLDTIFKSTDARLKPAILLAVGSVESERALQFLGEQLGYDDSLTSTLMSQIGRVASALDVPLDARTATYVSMNLASANVAIRREACITVGRIGDPESIQDLIGLLADDDGGVVDNAHWALERISGKQLAGEPDRWQRWYGKELLWWNSRASQAMDDLYSSDLGVVSQAIREVAVHRIFRRELTAALLPLLNDEDVGIVSQTTSALGSLRSRAALTSLHELREHSSPLVREQAVVAIAAIEAFGLKS